MATSTSSTEHQVEKFYLEPTIYSPNSPLPILLYRDVLPKPYNEDSATEFLEAHGTWEKRGAWGHSLTPHFHPNVPECYGVVRGSSTLQLGRGKLDERGGLDIPVKAGDVIVLPAGTTHVSLDFKDNYRFVGVYPKGSPQWINRFGKKPIDLAALRKAILDVPVPIGDPVYGTDGPLVKLWNEAMDTASSRGMSKL